MKHFTSFKKFSVRLVSAIVLLAAAVTSCDDDETISNVSIAFTTADVTISEAAPEATVSLTLAQAAPAEATFQLTVENENVAYGTDYTTNPSVTDGKVSVTIAKGQTTAQFKFAPVNNSVLSSGTRSVTFTLATVSGPIEVGTQASFKVTITDDEGPSSVNFEVSSSSLPESTVAGADIALPLSSAAPGAGQIVIDVASANATYGTHYTTLPAAVNGKVTIDVVQADAAKAIKVLPIENAELNDPRVITLTIESTTGVIQKGTNLTHTFTIDDNDDVVVTIAEVRAMYQGADLPITTPLRIQGIITSSNPQVNRNNIWVQDATAGIVVRFVDFNDNTFKRGDEVTVQLNGGEFTSFNGLLQVEGVALTNAVLVDEGNTLPTPEVITLTQLNTGDYEGKLVRVNGVAFVDANGVLTMNGSRSISDGTTTGSVRTESGASFSGSAMPYGFGTITGLAGEFNSLAQIIPIVFEEDVFANSPVGEISTTNPPSDFGAVENGIESASQQYTVQGTSLTNDIIITASANYKVSLDDVTFTASVTIPAASANSATTVYAKFTPVTGVNQTLAGTITHKSLGTALRVIDVTGVEEGNAASNLLLLENFTYTAGGLVANSGAVWVENSGGGTNNIPVVEGALTFTDYPSSNVGNSITLATSGQDAYRAFSLPSVTSGDLYASFLLNVTSAQTAGDYFFGFLPDNSTGNYTARTFIKSSGAGFVVGLSKGSVGANETAVYGSTVYNFSTTYLIVIKYSFVDGAVNDVANIFVLDGAIPTTEPGTQSVGPTVSNNGDQTNLGRVAVRQGGASNTAVLKLSGIRVAQTWADLFD